MDAGRTGEHMLFAVLRKLASGSAIFLAAWLIVTSLPHESKAMSSSSRMSRDRSSSSSDSDNDDDFGGDDSDSGSSSSSKRASRSKNSKASSSSSRSSSSSSSRSSHSSRRSSSRGGSSHYAPPAVVFGENYERTGVRPRGNLLSVEAFEALPCKRESVPLGTSTYYRCGGTWYNQVTHEGWVCYSEIYPPAGMAVDSIPADHETLHAGARTLYATGDAFYEPVNQNGRRRYVVVEPTEGLALDRLPARAREGIPVQSGRDTYYRYLGVFYREDDSSGATRYVAAPNPFLPPPAPQTAKTTQP